MAQTDHNLRTLMAAVKPFANVFAAKHADLYEQIFGAVAPATMDAYAINKWGNRPIGVDDDDTQALANDLDVFISMHADGWQRTAKALAEQYELAKTTARNVDYTENTDTTTHDGGTDTMAEKAFNDTEFSDSQKEQKTTDGTRNDKRTYTLKESKGNNPLEVQKAIAAEIQQRSKAFANDVALAVVDFFCSAIY